MFASVKAYARSSQKLLEYIDKKKNAGFAEAVSSLYDLKDILRGSIISDSAAQTKHIVEEMLKLQDVHVISIKNGFKDKKDKPFNPDNYADIKLILVVGSGSDYEFQEIVEIQVIQRINLELKKLEHKLYNFIREKDEFVRIATENMKLRASFEKATLANDVESADHLNNSQLS